MQSKELVGTFIGVAESRVPGSESPLARGPAGAKEANGTRSRPLLMIDIDGVLSLFAGPAAALDGRPEARTDEAPAVSWHSIEGIPHFLSATAAAHLLALGDLYEMVWASGWEERADEHLPHLLGLPAGMPFLRFERAAARPAPDAHRTRAAHWKLAAVEAHAGGRPLAWIDDALDEECHAWAASREAPTLLVQTDPRIGLTERETLTLGEWARALSAEPRR